MASYKVFFALAIITSLVALSRAHKSSTELVKFSYSGSLGPENWASLSSTFELCGKGAHQSPINIDCKTAVRDSSLECLKRDYIAANATLVNNGFNIGLVYTSEAGSLVISGKKYSLKHLRWHSPSEHTLDGERFPFEVNLIHESKDGNVAIVSILYKYGNADPFLLQITDKLNQLAKVSCSEDQEARILVGIVHSRSLKLSTRKYYRYFGSLTTPPCTENVVWNILGEWLTKDEDGATAANLVLLAMEQAFVSGGQHLKEAVLEGGVAFEKAHGTKAFEYMGTDPSFSTIFNKAMTDNSTFILKKMLEIYQGFKDVHVLVDIGGGVGAALRMIVLKYPHIKGINLDLPHVISAAPAFPGVEHVGGSMFDCIPHGDTILLKWILHNWSDEHCVKILKNCYMALPSEGKVIVVDGVLPAKPQPTTRSQATFILDVMMLSNFGGQERTKNEFENLAKEAGFAQMEAQYFYGENWIFELRK